MKTLVIAGAGPGLSLSLAKRFGKEDFQVALIARRKQELDNYVAILREQKIEAAGFQADVTKEDEAAAAFSGIRDTFQTIDVLIYNAARIQLTAALDTTAELANEHLQVNLFGGIRCATQVIPEMVERQEGAIMFTGGGNNGLTELPILTPLSIGKSGLRSYAHCLHAELADKGVYVGMLSVEGRIMEDTYYAPDKIADVYYDQYLKKDRIETFYNEEG